MIKKTITYRNAFGNEITDDFYFHLTQAELLEFDAEFAEHGGFEGITSRLAKDDAQEVSDINRPLLFKVFKTLISKSYGVREDDAFYKDPKAVSRFLSGEAYSTLFMSLLKGDESAGAFMTGILPDDVEPGSISGQTPRERSQAQLQGFKDKKQREPVVIQRTEEPDLEPQEEEKTPSQDELIAAWKAQQGK